MAMSADSHLAYKRGAAADEQASPDKVTVFRRECRILYTIDISNLANSGNHKKHTSVENSL